MLILASLVFVVDFLNNRDKKTILKQKMMIIGVIV